MILDGNNGSIIEQWLYLELYCLYGNTYILQEDYLN